MKDAEKKVNMPNSEAISENDLEAVVGGKLPSICREYEKFYDPNCGIPFEEWFWKEYEKDYPTHKK